MPGSRLWLAAILVAAALLPLTAFGGDSSKPSAAAKLLPRDTVVPASAVTRHFRDITAEASVGPNETSVGKATGSISVVFTDADGTKKVTLSVDEYASADDAAAAFQTAVQASEAAPGFRRTGVPKLGEQAFAGSSQVGAEMHYGLGARDGRLIVSATHAGDIPVTADNSNRMIDLADAVLAAARKVLGR
jgi:hypothetical protein